MKALDNRFYVRFMQLERGLLVHRSQKNSQPTKINCIKTAFNNALYSNEEH